MYCNTFILPLAIQHNVGSEMKSVNERLFICNYRHAQRKTMLVRVSLSKYWCAASISGLLECTDNDEALGGDIKHVICMYMTYNVFGGT